MARSAKPSLPTTLLLCSVSSPWADEVPRNSSSPAPALPVLLQQLSLKSRWWLILAMKLPQFPGEGIKGLPGRLQGWISKGKSFRSWNQALLPLPGCKRATVTVVLPQKVGKMFWAGKARGGRTFCFPHLLRLPSFAVPASPSCRASH